VIDDPAMFMVACADMWPEKGLSELVSSGLVSELTKGAVFEHIDELLEAGADVYELANKMKPNFKQGISVGFIENVDKLVSAGADIDKLVSVLNEETIMEGLTKLLAAGANIDVGKLVSKLEPNSVADNLDKLIAAGANIDVDELIAKIEPGSVVISRNFDKFLAAGANRELLEQKKHHIGFGEHY
jgi:hypothetical protein